MPGEVYAVASGKGGVGKTTTVVNLGAALRADGHAVAVVDADLGMANLATVLDVDVGATLHDVLAGEAPVEEALVEPSDGFGVLPGDTELSGFAAADPTRLGDAVAALAEGYEFVLIDSGAGLSHEDVLPLGIADGILLVTTPDPAAIGDTRKTAELAALVDGRVRGVVVTRATETADPAAIADEVGAELLAVVPDDPAVPRTIEAGRTLEAGAPDSGAAVAYRRLAAVLAGSEPPPASMPTADEGTDDGAADEPEPTEPGGPDEPGEAADDLLAAERERPPDEGESDEGDEEREAADEKPSGLVGWLASLFR